MSPRTVTRARRAAPACERLEDRCVPAALSIQPAHTYEFSGSFADAQGGPAIVGDGGTLQAGRYAFGPNQGLILDGALADVGTYSVVTRFAINSLNPTFKKILDFAGGTRDDGLYVAGPRLQLYPGGIGSTDVSANTDVLVTLTRDAASGETKVYLDNVLQRTYTGTTAVPAGNRLIFFEDDHKGGEAVGGSVDFVAVFNGVLTAADVASIASSGVGVTVAQAQVTTPEGQLAVNAGAWGGNGIEPVTLSATSGTVVQNADGTWSWSSPTADGPDDSRTVTVTATDSDGVSASVSFVLNVDNVAPAVASNAGSVTVVSGGTATMAGTWSDPGDDVVTLTASAGSVVKNADGTWSFTFVNATSNQTVVVTATDSDGTARTASFDVSVTQPASDPTISQLVSSHPTLQQPSSSGNVRVSGAFADVTGKATVRVDWGDGTSSLARVDQAARTFVGKHDYAGGGVFRVVVTLTDERGASVTQATTAAARGVGVVDGTLYVIGTKHAEDVRIELVKGGPRGRELYYRIEVRERDGWCERTHAIFVRADGVGKLVVAADASDRVKLGKGVTADVVNVPGSHHGIAEGLRHLLEWLRHARD